MPIYVYRCDQCGEPFEKIVSISRASERQTCPHCGSSQTQKLIASPSALSGKGGCGAPSGSPFS